MSRLVKPLDHQVLWSTGDIILRAKLELLLRGSQGIWHAVTFRVDSASDMTTVPAYKAKQLGLPIPQAAARGIKHKQTGLPIRSGVIRCQVVGMDQTEYTFPCLFLGDPDTSPDPNTPVALVPRYLLGLSGVVNQIRIGSDGTPAGPPALGLSGVENQNRMGSDGTPAGPPAPYGNLIVEKI
jgi:hypothetical protein